jgi:hypothetical protein
MTKAPEGKPTADGLALPYTAGCPFCGNEHDRREMCPERQQAMQAQQRSRHAKHLHKRPGLEGGQVTLSTQELRDLLADFDVSPDREILLADAFLRLSRIPQEYETAEQQIAELRLIMLEFPELLKVFNAVTGSHIRWMDISANGILDTLDPSAEDEEEE